jgi:hypothetical protein
MLRQHASLRWHLVLAATTYAKTISSVRPIAVKPIATKPIAAEAAAGHCAVLCACGVLHHSSEGMLHDAACSACMILFGLPPQWVAKQRCARHNLRQCTPDCACNKDARHPNNQKSQSYG